MDASDHRCDGARLVLSAALRVARSGGVGTTRSSQQPYAQLILRGAESLVLAAVAGALLRGWTLREFRTFPGTRLEIWVLIFTLIIAASTAEQLWLLQIQRDYPWQFIQSALNYASRDYLTSVRGFSMIVSAMLLVEGMTLLLFAARYVRESPEFRGRLIVALIVGGVGTASSTLRDATAEIVQRREAGAQFMTVLMYERWSGHIADLNAAGSYFVMTAFIALATAWKRHTHRIGWIAAACVLLARNLILG
jgi:hypothetical protein